MHINLGYRHVFKSSRFKLASSLLLRHWNPAHLWFLAWAFCLLQQGTVWVVWPLTARLLLYHPRVRFSFGGHIVHFVYLMLRNVSQLLVLGEGKRKKQELQINTKRNISVESGFILGHCVKLKAIWLMLFNKSGDSSLRENVSHFSSWVLLSHLLSFNTFTCFATRPQSHFTTLNSAWILHFICGHM